MPMDFCASFEPCEKAIIMAESNCRRREMVCTMAGLKRRKNHVSPTIMKNASTNPSVGDSTSGTRIFLPSAPQ